MITGIKIVTGAQGSTSTSRSTEIKAGAQVDGTILSGGIAPVGGGPEICSGTVTCSKVAWQGSSDFVWAFRVIEIEVNSKGIMTRTGDYTNGATLEDSQPKDEDAPLVVTTRNRVSDWNQFKLVPVQEGNSVVAYGPLDIAEGNDDMDISKD